MNPIIALFVRSLRQDSKSVYSHLLRGGLALFILFWIWSVTQDGWFRSAPGRRVFQTMSMINTWFITVAAIGYFATSITEEKEEKTLGLMQMAGISPLGLLLGKSISRLWLALVLIAIQLPFTLLSVTLGGVSQRQVFATYVTLGAYTFFLSGVATFISVVSRRSFTAVSGMCGFLIVLFKMSSLTGVAQDLVDGFESAWLSDKVAVALGWLNSVSIWDRLRSVMLITFDEPVLERHFIASVVGGSSFFLLAWMCFGYFANRHVDSSASPIGAMMRRMVLPKPRAWQNAPLVWKDFFFACGGGTGWLIRGFLIVVTCVLFAVPMLGASIGGEAHKVIGGLMVAGSLTFAGIEATVQSVRFISSEQSTMTLQLLGMLPGSPGSILYSKLLGHLFGLVPSLAFFLFGMLLLTGTDDRWFPRHWDPEALLGFTYTCLLVLVFLHLNVLLSTYIKWGAAPVSFGVLVMVNVCCFTTMAMGSVGRSGVMTLFLLTLNMMVMAAIAGLQVMIGTRFRELAGR